METRMKIADPTAPTTPEQYRAAIERQERVIADLRKREKAAITPASVVGATISGSDIQVTKGVVFINCTLYKCNIDDVSYGPFESPAFLGCILRDCELLSQHQNASQSGPKT